MRKEKNYFKLFKMFKMKFRKVTVELGESRPRNLLRVKFWLNLRKDLSGNVKSLTFEIVKKIKTKLNRY